MSPTSQMILFMCAYQLRTGLMVIVIYHPTAQARRVAGLIAAPAPAKIATPEAICSPCLILTPCPPVHVVNCWPRWAAWRWPEPRQRKTPRHPATPVLLADRPRPSVALARGPYGGVAAHRARSWRPRQPHRRAGHRLGQARTNCRGHAKGRPFAADWLRISPGSRMTAAAGTRPSLGVRPCDRCTSGPAGRLRAECNHGSGRRGQLASDGFHRSRRVTVDPKESDEVLSRLPAT